MTTRIFSLTGGQAPLFAWRSPTEVAKVKNGKMPAPQWKNLLRSLNQKGLFKLTELEDAHLDQWLDGQGNASVTREALVEYLSFALPAIKEARLIGPSTHYKSYSWHGRGLPGAVDYHESLFYFPTVVEDFDDRIADLDEAISVINFDFDLLGSDPDLVVRLDEKRQEYLAKKKAASRGDTSGISTHFSAKLQALCPDARADFAHMRWSTCVIDGVPTIFVHEMQSDWAQRGRAHAERVRTQAVLKAVRESKAELSLVEKAALEGMGNDPSGEQWLALVEIHEKHIGPALAAEWSGAYKKAPLVAETEHWAGFLLRRAAQIAVENNCQQVVWINGDEMKNGGGALGGGALDDFYQKICGNVARKIGKPFGAEPSLIDLPLGTDGHLRTYRVARLPVNASMREKFLQGQPLYSRARTIAESSFDPDRAQVLQKILQGRADDLAGEAGLMKVAVVREILIASSEQRAAATLIGNQVQVAFGADDPLEALDHEGFHFAYQYQLDASARAAVQRQFASGSMLHTRIVSALLEDGESAAALQAASDPEEAAAHAYARWRKSEFKLNPGHGRHGGERAKRGTVIKQIFQDVATGLQMVRAWIRGSGTSPADFVARIARIAETHVTSGPAIPQAPMVEESHESRIDADELPGVLA